MEILISNQQEKLPVTPELEGLIHRVASQSLALAAAHLGNQLELSIVLVDDAQIHELNRDHRGVDRPTDVLSFALLEAGDEEEPRVLDAPADAPVLLGDVIISLERARSQAQEYGHSLEREIGFLVAHGVLHLLGYDHERPEQEKEMFDLQESILASLGLTR